MAMGGADFSQLFVALDGQEYANLAAAQAAAAPVITYGAFIQTLIDFLLIAFVIFLIIKAYNRMNKPEEAAPAAPAEEVLLLREIRDSLKKRSEEHTSELQSLMRISYAVFCLKTKIRQNILKKA